MKHTLLLFFSLLLVANSSWGAEQVLPVVYMNDRVFTMCDAMSATGVCDTTSDGSGNDLFASVVGMRQFTVHFSQPTTGNGDASCDIYIGDETVYNSLLDTDSLTPSDGTKINSTSLSLSSTAQSFEAPFFFMWVSCTSDTGVGTHTVTIQAAN